MFLTALLVLWARSLVCRFAWSVGTWHHLVVGTGGVGWAGFWPGEPNMDRANINPSEPWVIAEWPRSIVLMTIGPSMGTHTL